MGSTSRRKGAVGERELAKELTAMGIPATRSARNGVDQAEDVCHQLPGVHIECKRVEALNLGAAYCQATQAAGKKIPVVCHRRNRGPWMISLALADLPMVAGLVLETIRHATGAPTDE